MYVPARLAIFPLLIVAAIAAEDRSGALPKLSPFNLRGGAAPASTGTSETIEFAGVSSIGKKTDLIFYDKTAKKSHWIAPGETKEGIAVVSYDDRRDEAVVKINGAQKTLPLRKVAPSPGMARGLPSMPSGFNTPMATTFPTPAATQAPVIGGSVTAAANPSEVPVIQPAPAPGSPAEVQKKQETEARMLVSDLLEIGMAQRRAYEEAQRKAADGSAQTPTTSTALDGSQPAPAQQNTPVR